MDEEDRAPIDTNVLVWAKLKGYSPWPGRIVNNPPVALRRKQYSKNPNLKCVFFFGTNNYGWVENEHIKNYIEFRTALITGCKTGLFKEACRRMDLFIEDQRAHHDYAFPKDAEEPQTDFDKLRESDVSQTVSPQPAVTSSSIHEPAVKSGTPKRPKLQKPSPSTTKKRKSLQTFIDGDGVVRANKRSRKVPQTVTSTATTSTYNHTENNNDNNIDDNIIDLDDNIDDAHDNSMTNLVDSDMDNIHGYNTKAIVIPDSLNDSYNATSSSSQRNNVVTSIINRRNRLPEYDEIDMLYVSNDLKERKAKINPTNLRIGFLGLGIIGSAIVKNLVYTGHKVNVWTRNTDKLKKFVAVGVETCLTPGDVVDASDVVFSCVSDVNIAKEMMYGNCGVLHSNCEDKQYVEMTTVDSDSSKEASKAFTAKGGHYLEAQIQGSKTQALDANLVLITSGSRKVFDDCQSAFQSIAKHSFYVGMPGNASKMNIVLQAIHGITLAGLAEGLALAERSGLDLKDMMEVLKLTDMASPLMVQKGDAMRNILSGLQLENGGQVTTIERQHRLNWVCNNFKLGGKLRNSNDGDVTLPALPAMITGMASEIFKGAATEGFGDHDSSAIINYVRNRYDNSEIYITSL